MPAYVMKAAAGLGKTAAAIEVICEMDSQLCEVYVSTHKLAEELEQRIKDRDPNKSVRVIYGRSAGPKGEPMCKKHRLAEELARQGFSVFPNLCSRRGAAGEPSTACEFYDDCAYISQFKRTQVRIYPHAYLPLGRSRLEDDRPDAVIIDESFWQNCVESVSLPISLLRHPRLPHKAQHLCARVADAIEHGTQDLGRLVTDAERSSEYVNTLQALRKEATIASPAMSVREVRKRLKRATTFTPVDKLLKQLAHESRRARPIQSVDFDAGTGIITFHHRMAIARFRGKGLRAALSQVEPPILILDASANEDIISRFFEVKHFEALSVERNAHVIQCKSTACSTTSLVPGRNSDAKSKAAAKNRLMDVQRLVDSLAETGRRVLIVGPAAVVGNPRKDTTPLLECPPNAVFAHFNAIRGIDRWKDHDVVIVIGRNQLPPAAAEKIARALYYDDPEPLSLPGELTTEVRGYRIKGQKLGVPVQVHPDRRVQGVMEQAREEESQQALDRLRLIHNENSKTVYLLSNLPLDVDIDELANWGDIIAGGNRLERAWGRNSHGVLPLAPKWLAATHPDLWPTKDAARKDVERLRSSGQTSDAIRIENLSLFEHEYRLPGQRRGSRSLSQFAAPADTAIALQRLLGKAVTVRTVSAT